MEMEYKAYLQDIGYRYTSSSAMDNENLCVQQVAT